MASDLLIHSELMLYSDAEMEFFSDSAIDVLQAFSDDSPDGISVQNFDSLDHFSSSLLSSSPPSPQLGSLSVYESQNSAEASNFRNGDAHFSPVDALEMKNEDNAPNHYNEAKYFLGSFSSCPFDDHPGFLFRPFLDASMESANIQIPSRISPENSFFTCRTRMVCRAGESQKKHDQNQRRLSGSEALGRALMEELSLKAERYSPEERKERISKYRAKRAQRNFNKTIKYACRKTLADNRLRVRGRFARNDETGETPKAAFSEEDDDELSVEGWNGEEEERTMRRIEFTNTEFSYCGW